MKASKRLEYWISKRVYANLYPYVDGSFPEVSFEDFLKETKENGYMKISNEYCDNTIFSAPIYNVLFRAWHDDCHIRLNKGFTYPDENEVAFYQAAELPKNWYKEKLLVLSDIIGQGTYFVKHNDFPTNQKEFTAQLFENGKI